MQENILCISPVKVLQFSLDYMSPFCVMPKQVGDEPTPNPSTPGMPPSPSRPTGPYEITATTSFFTPRNNYGD